MAETIDQVAVDAALKTLQDAPGTLLAARETELTALIAKARPAATGALAGGVAEAGVAAPDATPEDPRLVSFKANYDHWSDVAKARCPWDGDKGVKARLLGNGGEALNKAESIPGGKPTLFGADSQGNPLIANGGPHAVLTGMNYADTSNAIRFAEKDGKKVPTGYEMLSEEADIRAFETFADQPVVRIAEGNAWAGIWRESGEDPARARYAGVNAGNTRAYLYEAGPELHDPVLGVRCLLRVL